MKESSEMFEDVLWFYFRRFHLLHHLVLGRLVLHLDLVVEGMQIAMVEEVRLAVVVVYGVESDEEVHPVVVVLEVEME